MCGFLSLSETTTHIFLSFPFAFLFIFIHQYLTEQNRYYFSLFINQKQFFVLRSNFLEATIDIPFIHFENFSNNQKQSGSRWWKEHTKKAIQLSPFSVPRCSFCWANRIEIISINWVDKNGVNFCIFFIAWKFSSRVIEKRRNTTILFYVIWVAVKQKKWWKNILETKKSSFYIIWINLDYFVELSSGTLRLQYVWPSRLVNILYSVATFKFYFLGIKKIELNCEIEI